MSRGSSWDAVGAVDRASSWDGGGNEDPWVRGQVAFGHGDSLVVAAYDEGEAAFYEGLVACDEGEEASVARK